MKKRIFLITGIIIALIVIFLGIKLASNKTFFKDEYIGSNNKKIYIPKYSYFKDECCMWAATFYSLRSKKNLERKIKKYLDGFSYFDDESTYGYQKGDLFIQSYEVQELGLLRRIIIVY